MKLRLPLFSTLLVVAAAGIMVALGIWQLERAQWKNDMIADSSAAQKSAAKVAWPRSAGALEGAIYRRSEVLCESVLASRSAAGTSARGAKGWAHYATCVLGGGGEAEVALGWSLKPEQPEWSGGAVTGFVSPTRDHARLIAAPAQAGLEPLAPPDPANLPNNHLGYAFQWFFFALTALVIYLLALRGKAQGRGEDG